MEMSVIGIDHVDVYLSPENHDKVIKFFKETGIGLRFEYEFLDKEWDARVSRFHIKPASPEGLIFSVISPTSPESWWWGYLKKWGEGINHTAFRVDNIQKVMDKLRKWNPNVCVNPQTVGAVVTKPVMGVEGAQHFHLHRPLTGMWGMQMISFECRKCHTLLQRHANYCHNCGEPVYVHPSITKPRAVKGFELKTPTYHKGKPEEMYHKEE